MLLRWPLRSDRTDEVDRATLNLVKEIVVLVPARLFERSGLARLEEGIWKPAPERGYVYRIDPENPNTRGQRHVHIAQRGYTDRAHEISWNVDGTRHDRSSTGSKFTGVKAAQRIARTVLDLPSDVVLEEANSGEISTAVMTLMESAGRGSDLLDITYLVAKLPATLPVRARLIERRRRF